MMEEGKTIEVVTNGSFVYKQTIRKVLNIISDNHWYAEIKLLCELVEDFTEVYTPYKTKKRVPISVARLILETIIIEQAGEEVTIMFVHQQGNISTIAEKNN